MENKQLCWGALVASVLLQDCLCVTALYTGSFGCGDVVILARSSIEWWSDDSLRHPSLLQETRILLSLHFFLLAQSPSKWHRLKLCLWSNGEKSALPFQLHYSRELGALWKAGQCSQQNWQDSAANTNECAVPCAALTGRQISLLLHSQLIELQDLLQYHVQVTTFKSCFDHLGKMRPSDLFKVIVQKQESTLAPMLPTGRMETAHFLLLHLSSADNQGPQWEAWGLSAAEVLHLRALVRLHTQPSVLHTWKEKNRCGF